MISSELDPKEEFKAVSSPNKSFKINHKTFLMGEEISSIPSLEGRLQYESSEGELQPLEEKDSDKEVTPINKQEPDYF
jgi:hypothetical protein